jgi:hypothetical protein
VTVPHGLRSSDQRERRRHDLVEEAVATTELARYAAVLAEVDRVDWFGFWSELVLRVGVPIVPEYVAHQHAKARLLAAEYRRRRQPAACQGAVRGAEDEGSTVDLPWGDDVSADA